MSLPYCQAISRLAGSQCDEGFRTGATDSMCRTAESHSRVVDNVDDGRSCSTVTTLESDGLDSVGAPAGSRLA